MSRNTGSVIMFSVMIISLLVGLPWAFLSAVSSHETQAVAAEPEKSVENVVVVNETDTTLTVIFLGEDGNRGTEVPPRLAVTMKVNPERNTLEVKAIAYRKDGSVAGIANHIYHLKNPKESRWWKVTSLDF